MLNFIGHMTVFSMGCAAWRVLPGSMYVLVVQIRIIENPCTRQKRGESGDWSMSACTNLCTMSAEPLGSGAVGNHMSQQPRHIVYLSVVRLFFRWGLAKIAV
jgi:hypothetical protein